MRVLLSTIGSRGDVQPLVALASQLIELGQEARVCAPPDFRDWVEGLGIPFMPLGPEVNSTAKSDSVFASAQLTSDWIRQLMEGTVATQFETMPVAAEGCDAIVAGIALNLAARSVAEFMGIPYVFAAYCPITLPSAHHAPPKVPAWTPKTRRPAISRYGPRMPNAGPSLGIRTCSRQGPGSCPMSARCLRSWRRSSRPARHPSTSASAASAHRRDSAKR